MSATACAHCRRTHTHTCCQRKERDMRWQRKRSRQSHKLWLCLLCNSVNDVNADADAAAGFDTLKLAVRRVAFKMSHTPMLRAQSRNGSQSDRPESTVCFCFCCDSNSFSDQFVTRVVSDLLCLVFSCLVCCIY